MLDSLNSISSRNYRLERFQVHVSRYLSLYPMLRNSAEIFEYYDRNTEFMVRILADMAKGETTQEQRSIEHRFDFEVFSTWWDHLKYDLKEGRIFWLPKWIKKNLGVKYQKIVRKKAFSYETQVIRACPHAGFKFEGRDAYYHLAFLFPGEFIKNDI